MKVIILAGGRGNRLWPLSRAEYPKQFIKLPGMSESLFQQTFKRSLLLTDAKNIYVAANIIYQDFILKDIGRLGIKYSAANIISEPEAKNTLPAIYAAVHEIRKKIDDLTVVLPSDHIIENDGKFAGIIKESKCLAEGSIITFGIKPNGPNTGYGYISPGQEIENGFVVEDFKEKPELGQAIEYINKGYLWNGGIFMFSTDVFTEEVKRYAPEIYHAFESSENIKEAFSKINDKVSVDYGIMEKSNKVTVVPVDIGWNDLGSFDSFYDAFTGDDKNNIGSKNNILLNSENTVIHADAGKTVVAVDVADLIIIDSEDALLVCRKGQSQNVKKAAEIFLKRKTKSDKKEL